MRAFVAPYTARSITLARLKGTLVPIWCPAGLQETFFCRKQLYALNFQVVVDADG
jgi:integral membrane sensor domain MASE1